MENKISKLCSHTAAVYKLKTNSFFVIMPLKRIKCVNVCCVCVRVFKMWSMTIFKMFMQFFYKVKKLSSKRTHPAMIE